MSYGSLSLFYGGLESLLGPPQMAKDPESKDGMATLLKAMENEHCTGPDAADDFATSNGVTTTSPLEWEIVIAPKRRPDTPDGMYPERQGMRSSNPEMCRVPTPLPEMVEVMEDYANAPLRKAGHAEMIVEELVARGWAFEPATPLRPSCTLVLKPQPRSLVRIVSRRDDGHVLDPRLDRLAASTLDQ